MADNKSINAGRANISAEEIKKIVNEAFAEKQAPDLTVRFNYDKYIASLMTESKNPKLTSYLIRQREILEQNENTVPQFMMYEKFAEGLATFASTSKQVKSVIAEINENLRENNDLLSCLKYANDIVDENLHRDVMESINRFYADPNDMTRDMLMESLLILEQSTDDMIAPRIRTIANNLVENEPTQFAVSAINEAHQFIREQNRIHDQRLEDVIMKRVEKYLNERQDAEVAQAARIASQYTLENVSNKMGLHTRVNTLLENKDIQKNSRLMEVLGRYQYAMNQGCYEERIYESFIRDMTPFNYILPINESIEEIKKKAGERPDAMLLTRILEEMSESRDSYIYTELIVEDVTRFILEPNTINMTQAINALMPYAANPYINEMLRVIRDVTDKDKTMGTISESAMTINDQIKMIRENVSVTELYSPVLYIRENQSVFSIPNQGYYLKNGNTVCPLSKKNVAQLDESFVNLSRLIAQPNVQIDKDCIYIAGEDLWATIYEDRIVLGDGHNEYIEDAESIRRLNEMCMRYQTYDTNFFISAAALLENFNNIAPLHFAKKIVLNSNPNISAVIYRLDENLFLSLENADIHSKTFYSKANAIFCRNAINNHFQINVASLFEDLLPNQDKIILHLNETKSQYEKSIEQYEEAIEDLKKAQEDAATDEIRSELDDAIQDAEAKLKDVKDEYLQWQKETAEVTDGKSDDNGDDNKDVTKQSSNEPLDADEVEQHKAEMSVPMTGDENTVDTENASDSTDEAGAEVPVTDDEFSEYMAQEVTPEDDTTDLTPAANPEQPDESEEEDQISAEIDNILDEPNYDEDGTADENIPEVSIEDELGNGENDIEYDEESMYDKETSIGDDVPEEEIPSEEDVIQPAGDEDEYTTIDAETGDEYDGIGATDIFGGDTENPIGDNSSVDNDLYNPHVETSEFNVVNVMFDENVKTGTVSKSGEVMILRPMIDAEGNKYTEPFNVKFYLNADNEPVIETTDAISTAMYNAIISSVKSNPQFDNVKQNGVAVDSTKPADVELDAATPDDITPEEADAADKNWESDYVHDGNEEDKLAAEPTEVPGEVIAADEPAVGGDIVAVDPVADAPSAVPAAEVSDDDFLADIFNDDDLNVAPVVVEPNAEVPAAEAPVADPVDTYTDVDGTEIEVPAPEVTNTEDETTAVDSSVAPEDKTTIEDLLDDKVDDSILPESKQTEKKAKPVNEARKNIVGISIKKKK